MPVKRVFLAVVMSGALLAACSLAPAAATPSSTAVATPTPTSTAANLPTPTATSSPTPAPTKTLMVLKVPTPAPTEEYTAPSGNKYSNLMPYEILCPSENDEAIDAYNAGVTAHQSDQVVEAEKNYRRAIELDPGFCDAMDNLGQLLRSQGRLDEAIEWYQRSLEIYPENMAALANLGVAYRYKGDYQLAIDAYNRLFEFSPDNPEGYFGLGQVYYAMGDYELAISNLEQAGTIYYRMQSAYIYDVLYMLGIIYVDLEDYAQAEAYLGPLYQQYLTNAE